MEKSDWPEWLLDGNRPILLVGAVGVSLTLVGVLLAWGLRRERQMAAFTREVERDFRHLFRRVEAARAWRTTPLSVLDHLPPLRLAPREPLWAWRRFQRSLAQGFKRPAQHCSFLIVEPQPHGRCEASMQWGRAASRLDAINQVLARYSYPALTVADLPDGGIPEDSHFPLELEGGSYLILEPAKPRRRRRARKPPRGQK